MQMTFQRIVLLVTVSMSLSLGAKSSELAFVDWKIDQTQEDIDWDKQSIRQERAKAESLLFYASKELEVKEGWLRDRMARYQKQASLDSCVKKSATHVAVLALKGSRTVLDALRSYAVTPAWVYYQGKLAYDNMGLSQLESERRHKEREFSAKR